MPPVFTKKRLFMALAAREDPQAGLVWMDAISSAQVRERTRNNLINSMIFSNPKAAREYLDGVTDMDPVKLQEYRRRLEKNQSR